MFDVVVNQYSPCVLKIEHYSKGINIHRLLLLHYLTKSQSQCLYCVSPVRAYNIS